MNTFKKIGLTALATSMVASSAAYSADAVVSGSFGYTYAVEGGNTTDTKGIGMRNKLNFNFSGEMDNGWSVSANTALLPGNFATSSQSLQMTMGGAGKIVVGNGWGGLGAGFDAVTPTAYEEAHDGFATASTLDSLGTLMDNGAINWYSPAADVGSGMTVSAEFGFAPRANDTYVADGGTAGVSSSYTSGKEAAIRISGNGLKAGVYASEVERETGSTVDKDPLDASWFANYTMGSVSFGYQKGYVDRGAASAAATATTSAKTLAANAGIFEAEQMSIAFNINDNMTISYTDQEDVYDGQSATIADSTMDTTSFNLAYTVGSMSIALVSSEQDNPGWDTNAGDTTRKELSVRLAF